MYIHVPLPFQGSTKSSQVVGTILEWLLFGFLLRMVYFNFPKKLIKLVDDS